MPLKHLKATYNALPQSHRQALGYFLPKEQLHLCHLPAAQGLVTALKGQPVAEALPPAL